MARRRRPFPRRCNRCGLIREEPEVFYRGLCDHVEATWRP
jgi:hypothetical protein